MDTTRRARLDEFDKVLCGLWVAMTDMYGTRWTSQYGETPLSTWRLGLDGLSAADVGVGIEACAKSGSAWPPSLPEFRSMAKPNRAPHLRSVDTVSKLPPPGTRDRERARENIARMRELLNRMPTFAPPYDKSATVAEIEDETTRREFIEAAKERAREAVLDYVAKREGRFV